MSKTISKFPKGRLRLRTPRANGMAIIQIYYSWQEQQCRRSTNISVNPKDWDPKANGGIGGLKKSYGNDSSSKNNMLRNWISSTDQKIADYINKYGHITYATLQDLVDGNDVALRADHGTEFFDFALKRIMERRALKGKGTSPSSIDNAISSLRQFEKFVRYEHKGTHGENNELLYVGDITTKLVSEYRAWRLADKLSIETVNKSIQTIASICKYAADLHYITYQLSTEIADLYLPNCSLESDDVNVKYLTDEELSKLFGISDQLPHERQREILEMFKFSFYACGLRIVDVLTLRWKDIDYENNRIKKVQVKTLNRNVIPMCQQVLEILSHWRGRNAVYVFDLLKEDFDLYDRDELYRRRNAVTRTINTSIKRTCEIAGLENTYTFHSARHSWAVHALKQGIDISKIGRLLGHSDSRVTERIYAEYLPDTLDEVVDNLTFDF